VHHPMMSHFDKTPTNTNRVRLDTTLH